jgi:hypothetical protein
MKRSSFIQKAGALIGAGLLPSVSFAEEDNKAGKVRFAYLTIYMLSLVALPKPEWPKRFIMHNPCNLKLTLS